MRYFDTILERALKNFIQEAMQRGNRYLLTLLKNARVSVGPFGSGTIRDQDEETRQAILDHIKSIVPPRLDKHLPYYVSQVANGNLSLWTINTDKDRVARTLDAFAIASRKRDWTESRNIYDHKDWRELEKKLTDFGAFNPEYKDAPEKHSLILYTKTYVDKAKAMVAKLMGEPMDQVPSTTFWFRKIFTVQGACKYGRGTTWCTASTYGEINPENHPAALYLKESGLYIVEKRSPGKPRQPILQASGYELRGPGDVKIWRFAPLLTIFIAEALKSPAGQKYIDPKTRRMLDDVVGDSITAYTASYYEPAYTAS